MGRRNQTCTKIGKSHTRRHPKEGIEIVNYLWQVDQDKKFEKKTGLSLKSGKRLQEKILINVSITEGKLNHLSSLRTKWEYSQLKIIIALTKIITEIIIIIILFIS